MFKRLYFTVRTQVIKIEVVDVDEPPTFQNGPKPYMAVVPYNQPLGMHVYQVLFLIDYCHYRFSSKGTG